MVLDTIDAFTNLTLGSNDKFQDSYGFFDHADEMEHHDTTDANDCGYGFFEDMNEDIVETAVQETLSTYSSSQQSLESIDHTVICEVCDVKAPICCRSFQTNKSFEGQCFAVATASICVEGYRIVQDSAGYEAVEYKVKFALEEQQTFVAWRRFSDFKDLAEACREYTTARIHICYEDFVNNPNPMEKTLAAWDDVSRNRPFWFNGSGTNVNHIISELLLLKKFLSNLLFEVPCMEMLLEFVR